MPIDNLDPRCPVTLITGWLGAGKTTLLNRLLADPQGHRFAVMVNEFGSIGVDDRLVVRADEDLVELNNGCVCCTIRGDLVKALKRLRRRRPPRFRRRVFDQVLIETTGVAEPAPLLRTFQVEADIAASYRIEAVVGMADARRLETALRERSAAEQLALADLLVLNKCDLVDANQNAAARQRLHGINPAAPVFAVERAAVPVAEILRARPPRLHPPAAETSGDQLGKHASGPTVDPVGLQPHGGHHDIGAVSLRSEQPLDELKVRLWLDACVSLLGDQLIRYKGFLDLDQRPWRAVLQGVYDLYTVDAGEPWLEGERRQTELVFIGHDLDVGFLERGLRATEAGRA